MNRKYPITSCWKPSLHNKPGGVRLFLWVIADHGCRSTLGGWEKNQRIPVNWCGSCPKHRGRRPRRATINYNQLVEAKPASDSQELPKIRCVNKKPITVNQSLNKACPFQLPVKYISNPKSSGKMTLSTYLKGKGKLSATFPLNSSYLIIQNWL